MRADGSAGANGTESAEARDLREALRRLAQDSDIPPAAPDAERALLDAFDAAWERKRARVRFTSWRPAAVGALLAVAATLVFVIANRSPHVPTNAPAVAPLATTEFVLWPGASELPRFESGHLMRMELPVSALPALGLTPPSSRASVVQADVLVGQDGFPRAVRLSPDF
jgi:hypothetical protein